MPTNKKHVEILYFGTCPQGPVQPRSDRKSAPSNKALPDIACNEGLPQPV